MTEPEIHIFCQAVGDVKYALSIYARKHEFAKVVIHVVNTPQSLVFIKRLALPGLTLNRIEYPERRIRWRKPIDAISTRQTLSRIYRRHFEQLKDAEVYFFSEVIDMPTCSLIARLSNKNKVVLLQHYPYNPKRLSNLSFKQKIHRSLLRCVYRVRVDLCQLGESTTHSHQTLFDISNYGIETEQATVEQDFIDSHEYIPKVLPENAVLVIDSPAQSFFDEDKYTTVLRNILGRLKESGLKIIIKPHPRIRQHPIYDDFANDIIPSDVPAEFLPANRFKCVMGFFSTAIKPLSERRAGAIVSAIHLLPWKSEGDKKYAMGYVTGGKVTAINTLDELNAFLI